MTEQTKKMIEERIINKATEIFGVIKNGHLPFEDAIKLARRILADETRARIEESLNTTGLIADSVHRVEYLTEQLNEIEGK